MEIAHEPVGAPLAFFARVVTQEREAYQAQYRRARIALEKSAFDPKLSAWATADGESVGLSLVVGGDEPQLAMVAVREDWRRRGVGRALIAAVCNALRERGAEVLVAPVVSSGNAAAVQLLAAAGFVGAPTGNVRMRRSLAEPLPAFSTPSGYALRTLAEGEEAAYARLKSACFPEERPWTEANFRQEFLMGPFPAYERIFVAVRDGALVGTASAWEIEYGEGPVGLIHWVGVDPVHRGQGLGEALNLCALGELKARGYPDAWLNTARDRTAAMQLYERLGFALHRELYTYALTL
jgi:mycothiol synthase